MTLLETLIGTWKGYGQKNSADDEENLYLEISFQEVDDKKLSGNRILKHIDTQDIVAQKLELTLIDEFEFSLKIADKTRTYQYMNAPISFQSAFMGEEDGETIHYLDNNFIVNNEWQITLDCQYKDEVETIEFSLEKQS